MDISGAQIRAARALLDWSATRLASEAQVSLRTVQRFEAGDEGLPAMRNAMAEALRRAGVEFAPRGVSFRE